MKRRFVTNTDIKQWRAWRDEGYTVREIAKLAGRHKSTIEYHLYPAMAEQSRANHRKQYQRRMATEESRQKFRESRREYQKSYHRGYQRNG